MATRSKARYALLVAALLCVCFSLSKYSSSIQNKTVAVASSARDFLDSKLDPQKDKPAVEDWTGVDVTQLPDHYHYNDIEAIHRQIFSVSTTDQKYFFVDFGDNEGYNANIIPHRHFNDTYIIVAQQMEHSIPQSVWWAEWVCNARFIDGRLRCIKEPSILPIAATFGEAKNCPSDMSFFALSVGPHDARVLWGPKKPYVVYGSNSDRPCLGMWIQDFRLLIDWGFDPESFDEFKYGTEMMRPGKWGYMEKNWFVFWDMDEQIYVHHDIYPKRTFAKLSSDGSVGHDLAPAAKDERCMTRYMPSKAKILEGIHQATNSLSITLCKRQDPLCTPDSTNTFVFTIFHHKSYYAYHGNYEPYVMTFHRSAPFSVHGIATKPIWINGRTRAGPGNRPAWLGSDQPWDDRQSEMFYVTSISWAATDQKYEGFIDDILFISFGIEDKKTAAIDVVAGELFKDLGLCAEI